MTGLAKPCMSIHPMASPTFCLVSIEVSSLTVTCDCSCLVIIIITYVLSQSHSITMNNYSDNVEIEFIVPVSKIVFFFHSNKHMLYAIISNRWGWWVEQWWGRPWWCKNTQKVIPRLENYYILGKNIHTQDLSTVGNFSWVEYIPSSVVPRGVVRYCKRIYVPKLESMWWLAIGQAFIIRGSKDFGKDTFPW